MNQPEVAVEITLVEIAQVVLLVAQEEAVEKDQLQLKEPAVQEILPQPQYLKETMEALVVVLATVVAEVELDVLVKRVVQAHLLVVTDQEMVVQAQIHGQEIVQSELAVVAAVEYLVIVGDVQAQAAVVQVGVALQVLLKIPQTHLQVMIILAEVAEEILLLFQVPEYQEAPEVRELLLFNILMLLLELPEVQLLLFQGVKLNILLTQQTIL